jgi:hypothetical protein
MSDSKCSICNVNEIEITFDAETRIIPGLKLHKKLTHVKLCKQCADRTMENVCFVVDVPKGKII